jgi:hypothetical protein
MRTGFGSVFITKFSKVWIWGRILDNRGALDIKYASENVQLREHYEKPTMKRLGP